MAFIESRLLTRISFGVRGGPAFSTDVITVKSGAEQRLQNWIEARHEFELGLAPRVLSEFEEIKAAFLACSGRRDGFLYWDRSDYAVALSEGYPVGLHGTDQVGTEGYGYGTPTYQLRKRYAAGSGYYFRDIRKPYGAIVLKRAASTVAVGASAGNYALSNTTGIVTFVADQSKAISSHTVGASHVFTLASAFSPNLAIGGRIYVTGVTGTAADLLNDLSHAVTGVASGVITTSTNTAGLTASGGNAFFYPQPTEVLEWSGEFSIPVRFDVDKFDAVILDRNSSQGELILELPSIPLVELKI